MSEGIKARLAALACLEGVLAKGRTLDSVFDSVADQAGSDARDRAFARLLAATVLRRMGEIDYILSSLLHQPLKDLKPRASLDVLRLGVAQLIFLQTPPHAAVDTTVETMAAAGCGHHKALANAIMRRITREPPPVLSPRDAGRLNTPDWLWQEWVNDYGVEQALDIAAAHLNPAPLDITVRKDPEHWAQKLEAQLLPNGTLRRAVGGQVSDLAGYDQGAWWVQNMAAAMPVQVLGDVADKYVIDLCAAPGGKTAQLASAGAKVTALDRSASRMNRLRQNMQRLNLSVETVITDAAAWRPKELADIVLLDAPCTATGTIRHEPDVLLLKTLADQEKLAALQSNLLAAAARMVAPGGLLLFCTCSLQKEEGEFQAQTFLDTHPEFTTQPIKCDIFDSLLTPEGWLRATPNKFTEIGGIDGFFIARFARS